MPFLISSVTQVSQITTDFRPPNLQLVKSFAFVVVSPEGLEQLHPSMQRHRMLEALVFFHPLSMLIGSTEQSLFIQEMIDLQSAQVDLEPPCHR